MTKNEARRIIENDQAFPFYLVERARQVCPEAVAEEDAIVAEMIAKYSVAARRAQR